MTNNLFIDIHVVQSLPPSNVNRDDMGRPKTAFFGGVNRHRVSSQAWKRAMRATFREGLLGEEHLGYRTRRVLELLIERIQSTSELDAASAGEAAKATLTAGGFKLKPVRELSDKKKQALGGEAEDKKPDQTEYLIFFSNHQLDKLAELAINSHNTGTKVSKRDFTAAVDTDHGIELSLFGRMVADSADWNVDATMQVAHAISVHQVESESDYFTAVDDVENEDNAGAGMIGQLDFNSSTLYRYATINVRALHESLGQAEVTSKAVQAAVAAFANSMPTGKSNTFANFTRPEVVLVVVRADQPVNLVNAFESVEHLASLNKPRVPGAVAALVSHDRELEEAFSEPGDVVGRFGVAVGDSRAELEGHADLGSLGATVEQVGRRVEDWLKGRDE